MDWSKGFSASYHITEVDPLTWRDIRTINLISGSVKKESTGLRESADLDCDFVEQTEKWYRVWLDARQNGQSERIALFTGLSTVPEHEMDGDKIKYSMQCFSVLKPADDVLMERGWYAPQGFNGAFLVEQMLSVCPCPIEIDGASPNLQSAIIAEDGETRLSMTEKILQAINWRIRISGNGVVTLTPKATTPSAVFSPNGNDVVEPQVKLTSDWYDCPNVFRAIDEDLMAIARDDSEDSPLSTVNRGREIWMEELNCDLNDDEDIAEYAMRRLKEEQSYGTSISYKRRYDPNIVPSDIIRMNYKNITGEYIVQSQNISLSYGASVDEEVMA